MIGLVPVIIAGGIAKKFSEGMLGKKRAPRTPRARKGQIRVTKRSRYLSSKYAPF